MDIGRQFKKKAVVFDLDGTLADPNKRNEKMHKMRHEGLAKDLEDAPDIDKNVDKLNKARKKGDEVVIVTARSASYRPETTEWLRENNIKADKVFMRPVHDTTEADKDVKSSIINSKVLPKYKIKKAFDDKSKNVKMMKKYGIKAKKV